MSPARCIIFKWSLTVSAVERGHSGMNSKMSFQMMALSESLFAETARKQVGHSVKTQSSQSINQNPSA